MTRTLGVLAAGGVLLLSAACGGDATSDATSGASAGTDPMAAFQACLEKQGINIPQGHPADGTPSDRPSEAPSSHPPRNATGAPPAHPPGAPSGGPPQGPSS